MYSCRELAFNVFQVCTNSQARWRLIAGSQRSVESIGSSYVYEFTEIVLYFVRINLEIKINPSIITNTHDSTCSFEL